VDFHEFLGIGRRPPDTSCLHFRSDPEHILGIVDVASNYYSFNIAYRIIDLRCYRIFSGAVAFNFVFSERSRSLYAIARPSVVWRLSVTFVRPTQAVEIFGNTSTALGTLAIR